MNYMKPVTALKFQIIYLEFHVFFIKILAEFFLIQSITSYQQFQH